MKAKALQKTLPFRYNQDIKYKVGTLTSSTCPYDGLIKQEIQVTINEGDSFTASFTEVFEKYIHPPLTTEADMNL